MEIILNIFTVPVATYESCWFFGDDFGHSTFEQYFQNRPSMEYNGYMKAHFDTRGFFNNFISSDNPSLVGRMANLVVNAISSDSKRIMPFLKIVVIVPDADLINCIKNVKHDITRHFGWIINHVMTELERAVSAFKEYLPVKSLKSDYPHFLWIQPPYHDCFDNNSLCF